MRLSVCAAAAAVFLVGCAGDPRQAVSGRVTSGGRPIAEGLITFEPLSPTNGQMAAGPIANGQFTVPAAEGLVPGTYRVRITAVDPASKSSEPPKYDGSGALLNGKPAKELLPPKYNTQSQLTAEVVAGKATELEFALD